MKADPDGLSAIATRLAAAAGHIDDACAALGAHPPLASDTVSVAAAARLSAGAASLATNIASHGADLNLLAQRCGEIAALLATHEADRASAAATLSAPPTPAPPPAPLIRPLIAPDIRPPLGALPPADGETFATQIHAGDHAAGEHFGTACTSAASAMRSAATELDRAAELLPEVWQSTHPGLAGAFRSRAQALRTVADHAAGLDSQRGDHAAAYQQAAAATPSPQKFAHNRRQLVTAQQNNARTGGKFAAQVAVLTAQRGQLQASALGAHTSYMTATEPTTDPLPGTGTDPAPVPDPGAQPDPAGTGNGATGPGSSNTNSGIGGPAGLPGEDPGPGGQPAPGEQDNSKMTEMLPLLLASIVGGLGGALGGLIKPLTSLPQQLMSAGSSAAQGLTGGLKPDMKTPDIPGIPPSGFGGAGGGATTPAGGGGALGTMPPTVGAGSLSAPQAPAATAGAIGATGVPAGADGSPMGGMGPMMPPMAGAGGAAGGPAKSNPDPRKLIVPRRPNSEPVSGEITDRARQTAAAAGTQAPPDEPPRRSRVKHITPPPEPHEP